MCDHPTKLIAWLDRELAPAEMADVKHHLAHCDECRASLAKYEQASSAFDDYCHAVMTANPDRRHRRSVPALSAAAAALVVAVTTAIVLRSRVQPPNATPASPVPPIAAINAPSPPDASRLPHALSAARKSPGAHQATAPASAPPSTWLPPQPSIQLAIPADAMFPPGAIPAGVNFIADVNFAPDGSARQMRLRPRLTTMERSTSQP